MAYKYYNITGNMTGAGNDTTLLTFVESVNTTLNYVPATLMLVAIYIVLFMALISKGFDVIKAIAASSFVAMILAIIMFPMALIPGKVLIVFCILCPLSIFVLWVWGGQTV